MKNGHEYDYEIVNDRIGPIASALVKKYGELAHVSVPSVMFVVNHKSAGGKKKIILARTRKMPDKWRDILCQAGHAPCSHIVEFIGKTTGFLCENQITALAYRELRMIDPEGSVVPPDTNDWRDIIAGLGRNWFYPDSGCPDLLDDKTDWKTLAGKEREPQRA